MHDGIYQLTRTRNFSLEDVHVEGTERIVEAAAKYDVDRYIHVSSHSADLQSPSEFYATKVFSPDSYHFGYFFV
jgi:nucleoside-diphosphate-sugar epimerase